MALDKGSLASAIESALRNTEPGEDSVATLANQLADAVDAFVRSGKVVADSIGGTCKQSGTHPPVHSEGEIV